MGQFKSQIQKKAPLPSKTKFGVFVYSHRFASLCQPNCFTWILRRLRRFILSGVSSINLHTIFFRFAVDDGGD